MLDKYTALLSSTPEGTAVVPENAVVLGYDVLTRRIQEYRTGRSLPAARGSLRLYTVPTQPFETCIAVKDAIRCLKPNGSEFDPGFSLQLVFSYVSASAMQHLLSTATDRDGAVHDCITLEMLYNLISRDVRRICAQAAETFSHGERLTYEHWWQDLMYGNQYRDLIHTPLMQLFNSYGLRLEKTGLRIAGLAPIPLN